MLKLFRPLFLAVLTGAMADPTKVLESMASQLTAVAAGLEALRVQGAAQNAANAETAVKIEEIQQRLTQHDCMLTGDGPSVLSTSAPVARPQDWEFPVPPGASGSQTVTREECAAMITAAMQTRVGPALQAAFSQVGNELISHAVKINTLEHEVRMLKIRTAWTEKDLMYSQIEAAKRTLVVRNFPEWATAEDRELTVAEALKENNLGHLEWDLTTTNMEDTTGKKFLAPISILTVQTYAARKKVMDACSRSVVRYWHEVKDETDETMQDAADELDKKTQAEGTTKDSKKDQPGSASTDPSQDKASQSAQKKWEIRTWKWNLPIKMAPGITQFERRLGAPLHGLMNAYQRLFARFKKETLTPRWKTLILEDKEGAWLGRILYSRKTRSLTGTTGTMADWSCEVQLPAEHKDRILECWRDVWYDQLKQQISQTEVEKAAFSTASQKTSQDYLAAARLNRFLMRAMPNYDEGEEQGIENWVARFKFEYPWELSFTGLSQDHPDRQFFQDLRPVEELMAEMSADRAMETEIVAGETLATLASQGTKRQHSTDTEGTFSSMEAEIPKEPYYPFDSQEGLDQEVEKEKINHINRGYDISGYSTEQWQGWVKQKHLRHMREQTATAALTGRPRPRLSA